MADRADQEAARRRYLCNSQRTAYPNLAGPAARGFDAGWSAAMAAADEREEEWARLHFEALEREKVLEAREAALAEALREAADELYNAGRVLIADGSIQNGHLAVEASKKARSVLPVPRGRGRTAAFPAAEGHWARKGEDRTCRGRGRG